MKRFTNNDKLNAVIMSALFRLNSLKSPAVLKNVDISNAGASASLYAGDHLIEDLKGVVTYPIITIDTDYAYIRFNVAGLMGDLRISEALVKGVCSVRQPTLANIEDVEIKLGDGLTASVTATELHIDTDLDKLVNNPNLSQPVSVEDAIHTINGLVPNQGAVNFAGAGDITVDVAKVR
jgi:hypothetical protein